MLPRKLVDNKWLGSVVVVSFFFFYGESSRIVECLSNDTFIIEGKDQRDEAVTASPSYVVLWDLDSPLSPQSYWELRVLKTDDIMTSERSHYNLRCRARYTLPAICLLYCHLVKESISGKTRRRKSARGLTGGLVPPIKLLAHQKLLSDAQEYAVVCFAINSLLTVT